MKTVTDEFLEQGEGTYEVTTVYWQLEDIRRNEHHFAKAQNMWNADYKEHIQSGNKEDGSMGRNIGLVLDYLPPRARTNGHDLRVVKYSPTSRELTAEKTASRAIEYLKANGIPVRFHSVMD